MSEKKKKSLGKKIFIFLLIFLLIFILITYLFYAFFDSSKYENPSGIFSDARIGFSKETNSRFVTNEFERQSFFSDEERRIQGIESMIDSVVHINLYENDKFIGHGSGVLFDSSPYASYILTNAHVIVEMNSQEKINGDIEIIMFNRSFDKEYIEIVGIDSRTDLAVLRVKGVIFPTLASFGKTENLRLGETVIAIGSPQDPYLLRTVTMGIVSALHRTGPTTKINGFSWRTSYLQTDAPIAGGNSGGPLINADGEIIGITTLGMVGKKGEQGLNLNFAIPTYTILPVIEDLLEFGEVRRTLFGATLINTNYIFSRNASLRANTDSVAKDSILVMDILENSIANYLGLKVYDSILGINKTPISSTVDFKYLLLDVRAGDEILLHVYRNGEVLNIENVVPITP